MGNLHFRFIYFFSFFILISSSSFAQFTDKAEAKNQSIDKQRTGKWMVYLDEDWIECDKEDAYYYRLITYRDGNPEGIVRGYTMGDKLVFEGNILDDKDDIYDGVCKWYYETGGLEQEWTYEKGKAEGTHKSFYENGVLKSQGIYHHDKADGLHKFYSENGNLSEEKNYMNGKAEGIANIYFPDGKIKRKGLYRNHKPEGIQQFFNKDGILVKEINYVNGLAEGISKSYYPGGNLKSEENFVGGKAEGKQKVFYEDGKLFNEGNFKDDEPEGEQQWYYNNGKIKEKMIFAQGKANGFGISFYEDGKPKNEKNYKDHKIHGHFKNFTDDGKLKEEAIYIDDKKAGFKIYFDDGEISKNENFENAEKQLQRDSLSEPTRGGGDPLKGLNVDKTPSLSIGNYFALIIGIDKYNGVWNELSNAVNDAKSVETVLKSKYKFEYFRTLYDEQATRENVINEFEWLMQNARENDNVLIFYSGHGEYKKDLNKGYWVPVDATTASLSKNISNSDLQTFLGGIKSRHTLLISDACFSGDILRGNTISVPFEESEKYYKEVYSLLSRQALTSGGLEPVTDGGRDGHSVFTYYLLKYLNDNTGKYFDVSQLYDKLKIPVTNNSDQSPKFSPIKNIGDEGGQFIFIKK